MKVPAFLIAQTTAALGVLVLSASPASAQIAPPPPPQAPTLPDGVAPLRDRAGPGPLAIGPRRAGPPAPPPPAPGCPGGRDVAPPPPPPPPR